MQMYCIIPCSFYNKYRGVIMYFQYFRFFLSPIQGNILSFLDDSRMNSIKEIFKNDYYGQYRGMNYAIKFCGDYEDVFHLKIAKHTSFKRNKSPDEDFKTEVVEHWPNIDMIVSPLAKINDTYGQIIAIERKTSIIDNPTNLLKNWAESKNKKLAEYGYALSINPITQKESFWSIVKKYENQIEEVVFEYAMPNLFNTNNALEEDLKSANREFNASKAVISFFNKNGNLILSEENQLLRQSAEYVDNGGGNFKLKRKGDKNYMVSAKKIKTKRFEIEELNVETNDKNGLRQLFNEILGAE